MLGAKMEATVSKPVTESEDSVLANFAQKLYESSQRKKDIPKLHELLNKIKEKKFGSQYLARFLFFLFFLYLSATAQPDEEENIFPFEETELPPSIDELPGTFRTIPGVEEFVEEIGAINETAKREQAWLCFKKACLAFGEATDYYGFIAKWDMVREFMDTFEPTDGDELVWVHNHPPAISGTVPAQSSPTFQDFALHTVMDALLKQRNLNIPVRAVVVTTHGDWEFSFSSDKRGGVSRLDSKQPQAYLPIDSRWIEDFENMRASEATSQEYLAAKAQQAGFNVTFTPRKIPK